MYLPGPIYESIPAIYVASGVSSIFLITPPFSFISAVLFGFASWMVWKMRRDFRHQSSSEHNTQKE